jgi:hypothetical protein
MATPYFDFLKKIDKTEIKIIAVIIADISKYFKLIPDTLNEPSVPKVGNGSPRYLGLTPIQLSSKVLKRMSIPIVNTATAKTGSPTIGLKKVLSITVLSIPVNKIAKTSEGKKGNPLSTAKALIIPAPTTANAGCAKLRTSIDL